jgi:hypothetical protein
VRDVSSGATVEDEHVELAVGALDAVLNGLAQPCDERTLGTHTC